MLKAYDLWSLLYVITGDHVTLDLPQVVYKFLYDGLIQSVGKSVSSCRVLFSNRRIVLGCSSLSPPTPTARGHSLDVSVLLVAHYDYKRD